MRPGTSPELLKDEWLSSQIERWAKNFSRLRKADAILDHISLDHRMPSSHDEMLGDWRRAILQLTLEAMNRNLRLNDLEPECYRHFQHVWLEELKQLLAYFNWVHDREQGGRYWCPEDKKRFHYDAACESVRSFLEDPSRKEAPGRFGTIADYLRRKYLDNEGRAKGPDLEQLVEAKRKHLLENRVLDYNAADMIARRHVKEFYENIVGAAEKADREASLGVLRSLAHGGSEEGLPDIIDCFEATLAVLYVPAAIVKDAWRDARGRVQRRTTF